MAQAPYKTIFMGTPEFAVKPLQALIADPDFSVIAVITQPDKPVGRKQIITAPPVKELAQQNNIPVFQPNKIIEIKEALKQLSPAIAVIAAYGQILPKSILDIPKYKSINIHASLLPKYRGASCIHAAILNGDQKTGISIMQMDEGLDTGPIIRQKPINIDPAETAASLHDKLSNLAQSILTDNLKKYINQKLLPQTQDNSQSTYVKMLKKEAGHLDFNNPADYIDRQVRACYPWPGTFAYLQKKPLKILTLGGTIKTDQPHKIGELFFNNNILLIQCQDQAIEITKLQLAGKTPITSSEFIQGHTDLQGEVLT